VFKPGSGTITVWENVEGKRSAEQLYRLPNIPLTPGTFPSINSSDD